MTSWWRLYAESRGITMSPGSSWAKICAQYYEADIGSSHAKRLALLVDAAGSPGLPVPPDTGVSAGILGYGWARRLADSDLDALQSSGARAMYVAGARAPMDSGYQEEDEAPAADGNDAYTTSLLHFDGSDASTTFTDSNIGGSAHTWTANGNAQLSTALKKFGTASLLLDGTGDSIQTDGHADFSLAADWTIDFWFNRAGGDGTNRGLAHFDNASESAPGWRISLNTANKVTAGAFFVGGNTQMASTSTFTAAGWNHVAAVRTGNTMKLFINGTMEASDTLNNALRDTGTKLWLGQYGADRFYFNGSIDEFRVSKGIARWTADFTPYSVAYS